MPDLLDMRHVLGFVETHGSAVLFLRVFAEQSAIPLPIAPLLLDTGALMHAGRLQIVPVLLACRVAVLAAYTIWLELGRHRGLQSLRPICRLSFEADACVRRCENAFQKYGTASLLVPSGAYVAVGYVFGEEPKTIVDFTSKLGAKLLLLPIALWVVRIARRFVQRSRFLR